MPSRTLTVPRILLLTLTFLFVATTVSVVRSEDQAGPPTAADLASLGNGGLLVQVGGASFLEALCTGPRIGLAVVETEPAAQALRQKLAQAGRLGELAAVGLAGPRIPLTDRLAVAVVADLDALKVEQAEIQRIVRPRGKAWLLQGGKWTVWTAPVPETLDDWGQYHHDAAASEVSADREVGPARGIQWTTGPQDGDPRSGIRISEGVSLAIEANERNGQNALVARDAFSGLLLWRRPDAVPGSRYAWMVGRGKVWFFPAPAKDGRPAKAMRILDLHSGQDADTPWLEQGLGITFPEKLPDHWKDRGEIYRKLQGPFDDAAARLTDNGRLVQVVASKVAVLDADSGKLLWQNDRAKGVYQHPVVLGDALYLAGGAPARSFSYTHWPVVSVHEIVCFGLEDGTQRWIWNAPDPEGKPMVLYNLAGGAGHLVGSLRMDAQKGDLGGLVVNATTGALVHAGPTKVHTGEIGGGHSSARSFILGDRIWSCGITKLAGSIPVSSPLTDPDPRYARLPRPVGCTMFRATPDWIFGSLTAYAVAGEEAVYHTDVARTSCDVGAFPAHGLNYISPNHCFCQPYVPGAAAYHPRPFLGPEDEERLTKGQAQAAPAKDDPNGWPAFLRDVRRSAWTDASLPVDMAPAWTVKPAGEPPADPLLASAWEDGWYLQGPLTQPVLAEGVAVVAAGHRQQVVALDPATGQERWRATLDGRIDSAPTIHQGLVFVGARTGYVYALNRDTGALVWKFRAAPRRDLIIADAQLESPWPCFGSVVADEKGVTVVAGRHTDVDGGLWWWRLEPATGNVLGQGRFGSDNLKPRTYGGQNPGATAPTGSNTPPVVTADWFLLAGLHAKRDGEGNLTPDAKLFGDGEHGHWTKRHNLGILVPGNQGLLHRPSYLGGYKLTHYSYAQGRLFAWNGRGDFVMAGGSPTQTHRGGSGDNTLRRLRRLDALAQREIPHPKEKDKTVKRTDGAEVLWEQPDHKVSWRANGLRALAVVGDTVLVGFTVSNRDHHKLRAEQADRLNLLNLENGSTKASLPLPAPPVMGGIAVADGRILVACEDGSLVCFAGK
jgi:outer membrane protein assembly factor BamB